MTDKQYVRDVYKNMLDYYYENIGKKSKYSGEIITPKLIGNLTERYLEIGGSLVSGTNDINREDNQEV